MDTGLNFLMFVSAFETALLIIMWMYIYEFKMRTSDRIAKLDSELYEVTLNNQIRPPIQVSQFGGEGYDREVYRQKASRLLDMALVKS